MRPFLVLALLMITAPSAFAERANLTRATAGYLYFNRPGALMTAHDAELKNCMVVASNNYLANARSSPARPAGSRGIVEDWIAGEVTGMMLSGWERAHRNIVVEHCMLARGWRLMRLDAATGRRLADLNRDALAAELSPMVASESPPGEVARTWRNEAALADTIIVSSPRNADRTLLSMLAMDPAANEPPLAFTTNSDYAGGPFVEPVALTTVRPLQAGEVLLIAGLTGSRSTARNFELVSGEGERRRWIQLDYRGAERLPGNRLRKTLAFIVPAGEWIVSGFSINMNFCLGAPSFTANSGEVVFIGEFDSDGALRPDLSETAFATHVPATLATARSAQWVNGAISSCSTTNLYALAFEGFPDRPANTDVEENAAPASP